MRGGPSNDFLRLWGGIARSLGFEFHRHVPVLTGTRDGIGVSVEPRWHYRPRTELHPPRTVLRHVAVSAKAKRFSIPGLVIRPQGLLESVTMWFGGADIQVEDVRVDPWLYITAADDVATQISHGTLFPFRSSRRLRICYFDEGRAARGRGACCRLQCMMVGCGKLLAL